MLGIRPFYHIFGGSRDFPFGAEKLRGSILGAVTLLPFSLIRGMPVVIMPQFDPEAFCRNIEKYKVTITLIVPPVCLAIVHHPGTSCV